MIPTSILEQGIIISVVAISYYILFNSNLLLLSFGLGYVLVGLIEHIYAKYIKK